MGWQSAPEILLLFLAASSSALCVLYGAKTIRGGSPTRYVVIFVLLSASVTVWASMYAVQLASTTLETKLLAYKLMNVGSAMVPPAWFAFALAYSGRGNWLTPATTGGIVAIPLALLLALPTNPYSMVFTSVSVETHRSLSVLVVEDGPLYLLDIGYSYVVVVLGIWLVVTHALDADAHVRRQAVLVAVGALVPLVFNVLHMLDTSPFGIGVNLTPVSLSLSMVLIGWAVFRYRMLDLMPIASRTVLQTMSGIVIVLDEDERIVDLNPSAEAVVGDRRTVVGSVVTSVVPNYDHVTGETTSLVALPGDDGEERLLQLDRAPLTEHGERLGWVLVGQDVTDLERQRRALANKNERLDAFAQVVSHDLRNPLAVIQGHADLAEETGDARHFDVIQERISQMETFLTDLLFLSREGKAITDRHPVAIAEVVEGFRTELSASGHDVTVETDAVVEADASRLRQLFSNLFRNAREHGGDHVSVRVGELPNGFFVEDDGPGIAPDMRERVFEVGETTNANGTGLGLAIVRDIVEAHGWSITVTDGATGGARFEITGVDFVEPTADGLEHGPFSR